MPYMCAVQTCSNCDGTLVLRPKRRIPADRPTAISFVLVNNALPQRGFVPHMSAARLEQRDSSAIPQQNFTQRVLESSVAPALQVAKVGASSQVTAECALFL